MNHTQIGRPGPPGSMRPPGSLALHGRRRREGGWSLPILWILLLIVAVLYFFYGLRVLLWAAGLAVGITLLVWIYDGLVRAVRPRERFLPYGKRCRRCGAASLGQFVHRRRYQLRCTECGEIHFDAPFSRAVSRLHGYYEAACVREDLSQQRVLGSGAMRDLHRELASESDRSLILLRAEPE
jgi:hypothetical protein